MSLSTSRDAFKDCYLVWDKALEHDRGIRIGFKSFEKANYYRMRLHHARRLLRDVNAATFEADDPRHGTSIYDPIVIRLYQIDNGYFLYLDRMRLEDLGLIEPITELPEVEYHPPLQLEDLRDDGVSYEEEEERRV